MDIEKILTPQESIRVITEVISKTKENFQENSFCFLLWGWLIASASFAFFCLHHFTNFQYYFIPFPIFSAIGIVATLLYFKRKNSESTLTYTTYFINKMWLVLGVSFIMVVFINVSQNKMPFTYTLLIAGIGTLASGWVMKFQPLIIGGILFLVSTLASVYVADDYKPLLHGIAVVVGYLIPGYLLKNANA